MLSLYAFIVRNFSCKVFYDNFTSLESSLISRLIISFVIQVVLMVIYIKKLLMVSLNILTSHCSSIGFFFLSFEVWYYDTAQWTARLRDKTGLRRRKLLKMFRLFQKRENGRVPKTLISEMKLKIKNRS